MIQDQLLTIKDIAKGRRWTVPQTRYQLSKDDAPKPARVVGRIPMYEAASLEGWNPATYKKRGQQ